MPSTIVERKPPSVYLQKLEEIGAIRSFRLGREEDFEKHLAVSVVFKNICMRVAA
jgi:hypothetical protein